MQNSKIEKKLLHYTGKAIADFNLIETGDKVLVCLSGGKDSFAMVRILHLLQMRSNNKFQMQIFVLNQKQPGWCDKKLRAWLEEKQLDFHIEEQDTFSIVIDKIPAGKTYCGLCSRLRRGIIYRYAKENSFDKIALGHHRDDTIQSLLMSIFFNGKIAAMPPKLLTDDKENIVIRPLILCQEQDIIKYSAEQNFPIVPCGLCNNQENLMRQKMKELIGELSKDNPKIPSNMLRALQNVNPSHLMDRKLWPFKELKK
jgi:tRNA 2-thiocytidine biosynthesis protein TtcA